MSKPAVINPWFRSMRSYDKKASIRLFCFPFAGGSATVFNRWGALAAPYGIEVFGVQLPGREERLRERPFRELGPLVRALEEAMEPLLDRPFAFFGHSMGSLLAYELARSLRARSGARLAHLFVSGHRAPQRPRTRPAIHALPDEHFSVAVQAMGGTSHAVMDDPELREVVFPALRADLSISDLYQLQGEPMLNCPVTAFAGTDDLIADVGEIEGWQEVANGDFELRMFAGGHFFFRDYESDILRCIWSRLTAQLSL